MTKKRLHKRLRAELDKVFSLYIRERDRQKYKHCPFCGGEIQDCFHFITRAKWAIRWEGLNAVGSCKRCNIINEFNPHQFIRWFIEQHGLGSYDDLIFRSNKIPKFSNEELQEKIDYFQDELRKLLNEARGRGQENRG